MNRNAEFGIVWILVCGWLLGAVLPTLAWAKEGPLVLAASGGGGGAEKKKEGEPKKGNVYEWDPLLVNLADAGGKRIMKITIKMELSDPKLQEEIAERSYEIKDILIVLLGGKEFDEVSTVSGKTRMKQEIMARVNKILKNGQVKEIYFTDFIVQ